MVMAYCTILDIFTAWMDFGSELLHVKIPFAPWAFGVIIGHKGEKKQ